MDQSEELRILIARHATPSTFVPALPGVRLMMSDRATQPIHDVCEPTIAVVAQGVKQSVLGDRLFTYAAGDYLVVSVDLPIRAQVTQASVDAPFLGFGLALKPALIAALLMETSSPVARPGAVASVGVSALTPDLLDPIVRLLRLLERPHDIPVLAPMIEREILWRLLAGEYGGTLAQIGVVDSRLSQITRALRWIRANYAKSMRIDDLARLAAMSRSSFQRHFRAVTSMSPLQYQKQIRLQEARLQLLARPPDVAAVGHGVGYDSPSQFSREYRRLFGAPPGRDMARMLAAPPSAGDLA